MLRPGAVLQGRYTIERILGSGGGGVVYLARSIRDEGRPVAIKEARVQPESPEEQVRAAAQLRGEADLLRRLEHPGLVRQLDFFEETGTPYLVMEYVDGPTLQEICDEAESPLYPALVIGWVERICEVLEWLHSRTPPVLYRDLKPTNVMLDPEGRIRLLDFGLSRVWEADSRTRTLLRGAGTEGYAPPEQVGGTGGTDPRSDIYALGATMYALLTRRRPPPSLELVSSPAVLEKPRKVNPAISAALEDIILKMMAPRKEHRFQTTAEVLQALRDARHGRGTAASRAIAGPAAVQEAPALRLRRSGRGAPEGGDPMEGPGAPQIPEAAEHPPSRAVGPAASPTSLPGFDLAPSAEAPRPRIPRRGLIPAAPPADRAALPVPPPSPPLGDGGPTDPVMMTGASLHSTGVTGFDVADTPVPSWAQDVKGGFEGGVAQPSGKGLLFDRFWRWYLYAGILVVAVALVFPVLLNPSSRGLLVAPNSFLYGMGHGLGEATGLPFFRNAGGLLAQLLPMLLLAGLFYVREDFFVALLFALMACESLFEAGSCMKAPGEIGLARVVGEDLRRLLPSLGPEDYQKLARALHLLGLLGMSACLYGMGRWLYRYRPTSTLLAFYAGRQEAARPDGSDPIAQHGMDSLRAAEAQGLRLLNRALRPVVNLGLTWLCVLACAETGLLRLTPPSISSDKETCLYVGVAVISLVMFTVGEVLELLYTSIVSGTHGILLLLFPFYIMASGLIRLKGAQGLLGGWFSLPSEWYLLVALLLVFGGIRWHLDRITPKGAESR